MNDILTMCAVLILLLMGSAFFSAGETALTRANRVRLKSQEEQGSKAAHRALRLTEDYEGSLTSLLIGNNIVNTLLASLATMFCSRLFASAGVGLATVAVTILIVVFGEVCPKTYAGAHSEDTIKKFAPLLLVVRTVFTPLTLALHMLQKLILKKQNDAPTVTEDELRVLFDQSVDEGVLEEDRSELLQNALEFDDIAVDEILTPRVDLVAVELEMPQAEVQRLFLAEHFSRMPVYKKDIDHIVGVVSQKDFFAALATQKSTALSALMQPCLYVPPKKKISDLMTELQHKRMHVAVVTDEYGGTQGIVTLEDILEQLVGEIWDEHDEVTRFITPLGENRYEISGEIAVEDLYDQLAEDWRIPDTEAATAAGLALEELGHIPAQGETFTCEPFDFVITKVEEQRILKMQVTVQPRAENEKQES